MAITSENLLQPVKNTVSPDIFLQLAKETTLKSAVSELIKINNNLKKQAKESTQLKKEMEEEAAEAMNFYEEVSSFLEEIKKADAKGVKLDDKRMKDMTGHINKVLNKSKISGVNDNSRKVGVMKNASVEVNAKLSKNSVPEIGNELTDAVKKATQALIGTTLSGLLGGTNGYKLLTKGMIEEQYDFASEMNKIAFRSKGITDNSRDMQKAFRETNNAVRETGYDIGKLQSQMIKGARRGLKDSQSIAKTGLGLSKIIGVSDQEATALSDIFFDWNQKLGLSGTQLGSIAHEIKQVSRYSGLVGENLATAVKNSEKYLDKMRAAGNLTSAATKSTIILQAEAQKLGIDDEISDIMTALSSKDDLLKASNQTKVLLMQAANFSGQTQNLWDGSIKNSKQSLKDLASGLSTEFKQYSGGVDVKDINQLSVSEKANVDLKLKSATGKGIGDFERLIPVFEAAGASFSDKMNEINQELLGATSAEEKLTLERKKQDLYLTESMSNSSMFADAAKNATSLDDAIFRLQNTMNPDQVLDYNKELASIAGTFSNELRDKVLNGDKTAIAEAINLSAADALKKAGGGDYTQRVKTAISNKDTKKLVSLQEKMSKEQQKLGIKDSTIGDPIERATDQIKIMNENLVGYTGGALMWAAQTAGSTGIMAGLMGLIVAQGLFGAESIRAWGSILLGGFKGLKGTIAKGAGDGAVGAVSSVAARMSTASAPIAGAVSPMAAAMSTAAAPAVAAESTALTTATTAAGLSLGTLAAVLGVAVGVVGALTGSYWAGQEAANHFNTEIEDLTMSQLYASKGAGLLTGALNFLTLGVFNSLLGATGSLTIMLAKFNEVIPLLSMVAALSDIIFGIFYGAYKSVVNFFSGVVDAISIALSPLFDAIGSVINGISSIASSFSILSGKVSTAGSLFEIVSNTIGWFGTALGGIVKAIGYVIKIGISPFVMQLGGLGDWLGGIGKVLKGIFSLDASIIFEGIKQALLGIFKFVAGAFFKIPVMIFTVLKDVGPILVNVVSGIGKAVIWAFKAVFVELPKLIISSLIGAFKAVFIELPQYLWDSFFIGLKSLTENDMFGPIFEPFLEILKPIHEGVYAIIDAFYSLLEPFNSLLSIFSSNDGTEEGISLLGIFTSGIRMLSTVIGGFIRVALFPLKILFEGIGVTLKFVAGIITAFKDALMKLVEIIKYTVNSIIKPFEYLYDILVGHSIIPDLVFAVIGCFTGLAINVLSGLFSFAPKVLSLFQGMQSGIINSVSGVMEYIKSTDIFSSITSKFNLATEAVSGFFSPLMRGFNRARESGEGLFSSLKRGVIGQYNSITKGGSKVSKAMEKGKGFASTAMEKGKGFASTATEKGKGFASTAMEKGKGFASTAMEKGKGFASTAMKKGKGLVGMAKAAAPSVVEFAGKFMGKAGSIIGGLVGKAGLKTAGKSILKKLPGIGAIAGAGFALSELVQGNVGGAIKELGSGLVGAIPVVGPFLSFAVDTFGDSVISGAKWLGSTVWEGAKALGSTVWEGAKALGSTLWEGAKTLGSTWFETQKAIGSTLWEGAKSGWDWLFGNKEKSSPATTTASVAAEKYTNYTPPSQLVTPDNMVKTASVQPTGYVNVHDKVRRNKAEEDNVGSSRSNVDISELVVLNTEMLHYMMLNQENTAKIVDLLTSSGSLSGDSTNQNRGNTKGNSKPRNSPNYNQWPLGRYDQNASLQVVTTGV